MKVKFFNVFSKKAKTAFALFYSIISVTFVGEIFSLINLYFYKKDIYYFLVAFCSSIFALGFILIFVAHIAFFKQLSKNIEIMKVFQGNEKFILSFIKRVNELYSSTSSAAEEEFQDIENILSDISGILGKLKISENTEENLVDDTFLKIEEIDENINLYFFQSISLIESLIKKTSEIARNLIVENKQILNNIICPTYTCLEISKEWKKKIEEVFEKSLNDTFKKITFIKEINESNSKLIKDTVDSFVQQQKNSSLFLLKQKQGLKEFFSHIEDVESKFFNYLEEYSKEFDKIGAIIKNIQNISETMKMVSLNMNIEASKTHGNKAFNILAKELHNLSQKTENFANEVEKEVKFSLIKMREEKEKQLIELEKLHELINISKSITSEYDENIQHLNKSLSELISKINENNERNKTLIFDLFKSFQEVSITKEELGHKDFFISKKIEEINTALLNLLEQKKLCVGEEQNYENRKKILHELLSIISTKREKEFLEELYIKYLNEKLEEEISEEQISRNEEGIILF